MIFMPIGHCKRIFWVSCAVIFTLLIAVLVFSQKPIKYKIATVIARRLYFAREPELNRLTTWLGVTSVQYPSDNWVMQEIIYELKPDFIIETGTAYGGTTLFYATVLEKANPGGRIITVDIEPQIGKASGFKTFQERVEVIKGSSVSPEVIDKISMRISGAKTVLVTLDSLHTEEHVAKELNLYSKFVSLNSYIVVQDSHQGHFKGWKFWIRDNGAFAAIKEFLKVHKEFKIDHTRERFIVTKYLSGFLKRIR